MKYYPKEYNKLFFYLIIASLLLSSYSYINNFKGTHLQTGIYDDGRLIVSKNDSLKIITGVINSNEDDIVCKLYFYTTYSELINNKVHFYNFIDNEIHEGKLFVEEKKIRLVANDVIFPCQRIIDLTGGEYFYFTKPADLNEVLAVIKSRKAYLYDEPDKITSKLSYFIAGDIVSIKERKDNWIKVSYLKKPNLIRWVKLEDIKIGDYSLD